MLFKILSATIGPMLDQVSLAPVSEYSRKPSVFYEIKELWVFGLKTIIIFNFKYWECFLFLVGQNLGLKCNRQKTYFWHHRMLSKGFIHGESSGDFPVAMPALFSGCHVSNPLSTFDSSLCLCDLRHSWASSDNSSLVPSISLTDACFLSSKLLLYAVS